MAAAEARAAWQRAANRCLAQEDRKRAPKLACCPSSSEQQHGANNGNCKNSEDRPNPNFMPLGQNHMNSNLSPDIRWWIQLQPNFGVQNSLASEKRYSAVRNIGEKELEDLAPKSEHEEPLVWEAVDTSGEKSEEVFEPPSVVSTAFMKYSSEKDVPWKEGEQTRPWWRIADENELASLVAERATQNFENCDLPRPTQTVRAHRTEQSVLKNIGDYWGPPSSAEAVSHVVGVPVQYDHFKCSYSTESTDELNLSSNGVWEQHEKYDTDSDTQDFSSSSNTVSKSKQMFQEALERDQILEALRHSQTRAREAEMAAKKVYDEKEDVVKLLLREASHLFACNQWLKILQLENIVLQLKHKENQIATIINELPWMVRRGRPMPGRDRKDLTRRSRRQKGRSFYDAILLALGLGLAGAGFLLGWTLGWLLPKL